MAARKGRSKKAPAAAPTDLDRYVERLASSASILLWRIDAAGILTFTGGPGYELLGTSAEKVLGKSVYEEFADFKEALEYYERALRGETLHHQFARRGRVLENHYFPSVDAAGTVVGVNGFSFDVTDRVAAEERARRSHGFLAEAQALAAVGCWEYDFAHDRTTWSDEVYRIYRAEPGSITPTNDMLLSRVVDEDRALFEAALAQLDRDGESQAVYRIRRMDDDLAILHARGRLERDAAGAPVRMFGTVQDVTERESVRDELRRAKEAMAEAQRIAQIGNWEVDIEPLAVRWSEQAFTMLGVDRDTPNLADAFSSRIHPDDRERVDELVRAAVQDGAPYPVHTYRLLHPVLGLRVLEARGEVVRDASGRVVRMVGTMQDVTEREARRSELQRAREGFAEARKLTRLGIWEWLDGVDEGRWSEEVYEIFGIPPSAPPSSLTYFRCVHPDDRERLVAIAKRTLEEDVPYPTTLYRVLHGERMRVVEQRANVLRDPSGKPIGFIGTVQDVTEREDARARLATLTTALDQAADAVFITDREGVIAYANEAFYRQTQYGPADVLGRTPRVLKSGIHDEAFYVDLWSKLRKDEDRKSVV